MKIFKPTIALLNKMKYSKKFIVIGLILIVPLITVSLLYLMQVSDDMNQIEKRVEGAEYNLALKDLMQYMQKSRVLNITLVGGDTSVKDSIKEANANVNNSFQKIQELEANLSREYNWAEKTSLIQQNWNRLEQTTWTSSKEILNEYSAVLVDIISLMSEVANDSELLLALSPESFNLVYNTTIELPKLTENLAQMRSMGVNVINSETFTDEQLDQLNDTYIPIKSMISSIQNTMPIVFNNPNFKESLEERFHEVMESTEKYLTTMSQITKGTISSTNYYTIATTAIDAIFDYFTLSFDVLFNYLDDQYNELYTQVVLTFLILVIVILVAIFLFISLFIAIKQSINALENATEEVANGNLDVQVSLNTKDEMSNIEKSFNHMVNQLNDLVRQIATSAEHVSTSSQELHASSEEITAAVEHTSTAANQMAQDAELQASSLKESVQAINEMALGIERIAENSTRVSNLTNDATTLANDGNVTVEKAFKQMEMIRDTVTQSSEKIEQLNEQSRQIDAIVNIITEIAEQTNLLSLNAAIEAARAGEHGKGFAVVADEVRKLAEQSRTSASQIAELIRTIQTDTNQSVQLMHHVTQSVASGIQVMEETANKFENILASMNTLKPQMEDISSTAVQFSAQTQEVASTMQQILQIAQQTSEATEEIAASSEEQLAIMEDVSSSASSLSKMAETLQSLVSRFKLS